MIVSSLTRTLCACVAVAAMSGCTTAGSSPAPGLPGVAARSAQSRTDVQPAKAQEMLSRLLGPTLANRVVPVFRHNHRRSWMRPDASKSEYLLYASDLATGTVDVYSYLKPNKRGLLGQLTGFTFPAGECSDTQGDVYIADMDVATVTEFAKGGTTPLRTLTIPLGTPVACSVDKTTGNVAVTAEEVSPVTLCGGIWVFPPSGSPTLFNDANVCLVFPAGYDQGGNLWLEASLSNDTLTLVEVPQGSTTLVPLTLNGFTIIGGSTTMFAGNFIIAVDNDYTRDVTVLDRVTVAGGVASLSSAVTLTDTCDSTNARLIYPWIDKHQAIGGNGWCRSRFAIWDDDVGTGGNPKKVIDPQIAPALAFGVAVSRGQ